jgi:hypothetical protein
MQRVSNSHEPLSTKMTLVFMFKKELRPPVAYSVQDGQKGIINI